MMARYSTNRWNSGPSHASVASALAFAAIAAATLFDAEAVEEAFVAAPALAHPHPQVEEDAVAEQRLHLLAGTAADVANHPPALTDQDPLLRLGLRPGMGQDGDEPVLALADLVDLDLDSVGDLVVRPVQDLLTDDLGQADLERQVGLLVRWVEERALRHQLDQGLHDVRQAGAGLRAHGKDLPLDIEFGDLGQALDDRCAVEQVHLVEDGDGGQTGSLDGLGDEGVSGADLLVAFDDEERSVRVAQLRVHAPLHALGQRIAWPLDARQVDHDDLPVSAGGDAADGTARRLRPWRGDRDLGPDDLIQQRRFAGVRPTRQSHEACARHSASESITRSCKASIRPSSVSWS